MKKPYQKMHPLPQAPTATPAGPVRRLQVRRSGVHGKGVFAQRALAAGERLAEYTGEVIAWDEALRRHPHDPANPHHTFFFHIDGDCVIDAKVGGNSTRWINHSCVPNCEATQEGQRVFIGALRDIAAGEELFYDYGLVLEEPLTAEAKADYPCWCGHTTCRGTLLAPAPVAEPAPESPPAPATAPQPTARRRKRPQPPSPGTPA